MYVLVTLLYTLQILSTKTARGNYSKILQMENIFEDIESLTVDLMYKTREDDCYAIVTDKIYQSILSAKLFKSVSQTTYLIVLVPDFMDTLRPEPIFLLSLMQAQRSGCGTFLIYLANGIQMERFLRFVDQFRVLDTRSKFILLHDYRLFSKQLHYLWKRIVNVIFVKENDYSRRGNFSTGTWFELTTVPFPLPIKEVYVDKKLDIWRSGRYQKGVKLFENKLSNFNGEKLKAVVLKHTPGVSAADNNGSDFCGVEVEILNTMGNAMNFSIQFYETEDSQIAKWGRLQRNGSASGLLGEMISRHADFGIADLYYTPHHLSIMDLSIPYSSYCLTFLTPESLTDNSWKTLILPFSNGMWLGVLFFLFSVGFVFYILGQVHMKLRKKDVVIKRKNYVKKTERIKRTSTTSETISMQIKILPKRTRHTVARKDIFESFGNCILYTYSMLLVVSLPRFPQNWSIRLLTGWYWVYCILVV
ncbi:Glutamate receptor ionotropic, delta-1, partial [Pseudolycoriella hygida]